MKKALSYLSALILVFGIALALPPELSAKKKPAAKKTVPVIHDTVSLVSDTSITVAGKKESKTYSITKFTKIIVNGKSATTTAIQLGMSVMVGADSNGAASLINANTAIEPPKSGKKK